MMFSFLDNLYFQLYSKAAEKGLSITNFQLVTPANLTAYLNGGMRVYAGLRSIHSAIGIMGLNEACTEIARAVSDFIPQIRSLYERFLAFPFPKKLLEWVDKFFGVFWTGETNTIPQAHWMSFANSNPVNSLDWTLTASITEYLRILESLLDAMTPNTPDTANIIRIMGFLYGRPQYAPAKPVCIDASMYYNLLARGFQWRDTTTNQAFFQPDVSVGIAGTTNFCPVLIWGDPAKAETEWTTLLRPSVFGTGSGTVAVETYGAMCLDNSGYMAGPQTAYILHWVQNTGAIVATSAASVGIPAAIVIPTLGPLVEYPFATLASTGATVWATDARALPGYTTYYLSTAELFDSSLKLIKDWLEI
jgi:hypothetical protein